jgi:hypothetical protein
VFGEETVTVLLLDDATSFMHKLCIMRQDVLKLISGYPEARETDLSYKMKHILNC